MNALVLAAGYATRLRPLTDDVAKSLLPVGGRPMLDWILDKLEEVDSLDAVHVVTNSRYAHDFDHWAARAEQRLPIVVHDDGTTSNEDRLGAIGDIQLTVERAGLGYDDLLVVAGDNLFDFSLTDLVAFWRGKGTASAVALYDCGDLELATHYGVVAVDGEGRVRSFVEKPSDPASTLAATATYVYHREHVALVGQYLDEGEPPTRPATSSRGCTGASRCTGTRSRAPGSTSGTTTTCSWPTTCCAGARACPRSSATSSILIRHRRVRFARLGSARARPAASAALPRLLQAGCAALRRLPRGAAAPARAALRPVRRADRLAGRALPRVCRPAARLRLGAGRGRL